MDIGAIINQQFEAINQKVLALEAKVEALNVLPEFLPVVVAAEMIQRSDDTVRRLAASGLLKSKTKGNSILIETQSILAYRNANPGQKTTKKFRHETLINKQVTS